MDNEEQNFLPNLLLFLLKYIWKTRQDWFFGVDMGVYHTTGASPRVPIVPDGFLSLGVVRRKGDRSRRSYVTWEENEVVPLLTLEIVSHTPGGEYDDKLAIYARLGVLYYVVYNPEYWRRDGQMPFEVYKLVNGSYQLQIGEPYWMPEIGLGIGRSRDIPNTDLPEVLCWFDESGRRYLIPEELAERECQRADAAQQQVEELLARLRELGKEPRAGDT